MWADACLSVWEQTLWLVAQEHSVQMHTLTDAPIYNIMFLACTPPPTTTPHLGECVGVSEGEAATETGSGDQLVRTGVQTVFPSDWYVHLAADQRLMGRASVSLSLFSLFVFFKSVCLSLPTSHFSLFQSGQSCVRLQRCFHPLPDTPVFVLHGWHQHHTNTNTHTNTYIMSSSNYTPLYKLDWQKVKWFQANLEISYCP